MPIIRKNVVLGPIRRERARDGPAKYKPCSLVFLRIDGFSPWAFGVIAPSASEAFLAFVPKRHLDMCCLPGVYLCVGVPAQRNFGIPKRCPFERTECF